MPPIIFRSMPDSAYLWTAMMAADEKGLAYSHEALALGSPEHLALHPFGKMPVLQDGDRVLFETLAICVYLDEAFEGPPLQPATPAGRAQMLKWIGVVNAYVFPVMNRFMKERLVRPAWGFDPDRAFIASARDPLGVILRELEAALSAHPCLAGEDFTLADIFLLPQLKFFALTPEGEAFMARAPASADWLGRMSARKGPTVELMNGVARAFPKAAEPELAWALPPL
ncbi:glutathione S-transferase family protein [Phenylobacterium sp.]|uniref:glutathione S-transferase family protein n=1 Tax=Phenylobacterium sp. TaxID=1871053 RepID=UPI002FDA5FBC